MQQFPPDEASEVPATVESSPATRSTRSGRFAGFQALRVPAYRWYALCAGLQQAAESMQTLANGWFAYELTGSAVVLGYTVLAQAIPQMLLTFAGGVISDRFLRTRVWQICNFAACAITLWISISVFTHVVTWQDLVIRAFLFGVVLAIRAPSRQGVMTETVPREQIMSAVTINQMVTNVLQFMGPAAAGLLIAFAGIGWTYVAITLCYGGAVFALLPIRYVRRNAVHQGGVQRSFWGSFKDGLVYVRRSDDVRPVLTLSLLAATFATPFSQLMPVFAKTILHTTPASLGLLNSLTGLGALTGAVFITFVRPKIRGAFFVRVDFLIGLALVAFCVSSHYWLSGAIVFGVGLGQSIRQALSNTLIQTYTEDAYLGRVISINVTQGGLASLSAFAVAFVAEAVGIRQAIFLTSICLTTIGACYWMFSQRLRQLE